MGFENFKKHNHIDSQRTFDIVRWKGSDLVLSRCNLYSEGGLKYKEKVNRKYQTYCSLNSICLSLAIAIIAFLKVCKS